MTLSLASQTWSSVIEVPGLNQKMSGVYFFAGWKCIQGTLTGRINGGTPFPLAGKIKRPDTEGVCSNSGNNGWIAQYNFNRLSQGAHTFEAFDGVALFASVVFQVVHFGVEFKTGVTGSGSASLSDGSSAQLIWTQGLQAFTVSQATPGNLPPPPSPPPTFPNVAGVWSWSVSFVTEDCNFLEVPGDLPITLGGTFIVSQNGATLTVLVGTIAFTGDVEPNGDFFIASSIETSTIGSCTIGIISGFAGNFLDGTVALVLLTARVSGSCPGLSLPCSVAYAGSLSQISAVSFDSPDKSNPDPVQDVLDAIADALRREESGNP